MSDPLQIMETNEPLRSGEGPFNRQFHNLAVEAIRWYLSQNASLRTDEKEVPEANQDVFMVNTGTTDIPQFGVCGIGTPSVAPSVQGSDQNFRNETLLSVAAPSAGGTFAIAQHPIGKIGGTRVGEVRLSGPTKVLVNMSSAAHTYAASAAGNYANLVSQATAAPAKILWSDTLPAASIGSVVLTGSGAPGAGLGVNGNWYHDTTNHVYYGPKTAGSWGSSSPDGTGIVWALVLLDMNQASSGGGGGTPNIITSPATGTATGPTFTATMGTSGADLNWSAASSTLTLNVPDAGNASRGVVTTVFQSINGVKTLETTCNVLGYSTDGYIASGSGVNVFADGGTNSGTGSVGGGSGSVTFSNGTPTMVTWAGNGLTISDVIYFSGVSLPTGINAGTPYYVVVAGNPFEISTTPGGTAIGTTSTGSGTATAGLGGDLRVSTSSVSAPFAQGITGIISYYGNALYGVTGGGVGGIIGGSTNVFLMFINPASPTSGNPNRIELAARLGGGAADSAVCYSISPDGSSYKGIYGTDTIGNVFKGGINTQLAGTIAGNTILGNVTGSPGMATAIPLATGLGLVSSKLAMTVPVVAMADATSFTPTSDTAQINIQTNTQAAGTLTANAPTGSPVDGQKLELRLTIQNAQTFSWNAVYKGCTTVPLPTSATASNKTDRFFFEYNSGTSKWEIVAACYGY